MYDFMPVPYSLDNYSFNLKGFFFLKKKLFLQKQEETAATGM